MLKEVPHIFDHLKKDEFNLDEVGTRFQGDTLVIFYRDYCISLERFFYIVNTTGIVKLSDFKQGIF